MIVCRIRKWAYAWLVLLPMCGVWLLFSLSLEGHKQWFDQDQTGYLVSMATIIGALVVFPLLLFKWFFKELEMDAHGIGVKTFLPVKIVRYPHKEVKQWYLTSYMGEKLHVFFTDGKKISFTSTSHTNFRAAKQYLQTHLP